jgi:hypothetical protein
MPGNSGAVFAEDESGVGDSGKHRSTPGRVPGVDTTLHDRGGGGASCKCSSACGALNAVGGAGPDGDLALAEEMSEFCGVVVDVAGGGAAADDRQRPGEFVQPERSARPEAQRWGDPGPAVIGGSTCVAICSALSRSSCARAAFCVAHSGSFWPARNQRALSSGSRPRPAGTGLGCRRQTARRRRLDRLRTVAPTSSSPATEFDLEWTCYLAAKFALLVFVWRGVTMCQQKNLVSYFVHRPFGLKGKPCAEIHHALGIGVRGLGQIDDDRFA